MTDRTSMPRTVLGLVLWVALSMAAGVIGSRFRPGAWYDALAKPTWNPPAWVFAPVWTTLYLMMGVAAWLVWRRAGVARGRAALGAFVVQLALNALWSYLFFGLHRPDLAFVDIVALWLAIVATIVTFRRHSTPAAWMLAPYLAWVSFAAALNGALWGMNA